MSRRLFPHEHPAAFFGSGETAPVLGPEFAPVDHLLGDLDGSPLRLVAAFVALRNDGLG